MNHKYEFIRFVAPNYDKIFIKKEDLYTGCLFKKGH